MDTSSEWVAEAMEAMANLGAEDFERWLLDNPTGTIDEYKEDLIEALQTKHRDYWEQFK